MLLFNIKERFVVVYEKKFLLISMFISLAENIEIPLLQNMLYVLLVLLLWG